MPIADFFIIRILDSIRRETDYDEDDVDMMRYSLQAILWEIEKTIYLFIIFTLLSHQWQLLAAMFAVMTIRPYAGGFHSSTAWGCFWWTLFGFLLAIFALPHVPLTNLLLLIVALFSIVTTFIATPIRTLQKERIADKSKDGKKKFKATIITIIWFIILFLNQTNALAPVVVWTIFLQNFQLLIEYLKRKIKPMGSS
jgi:accessory gene regulator B